MSKSNRKRYKRGGRATIWGKQAAWLIKTIVGLHESPTGHGLKWTYKMICHYKRQYDELAKHTPVECKKQAIEYGITLDEIMDEYSELI